MERITVFTAEEQADYAINNLSTLKAVISDKQAYFQLTPEQKADVFRFTFAKIKDFVVYQCYEGSIALEDLMADYDEEEFDYIYEEEIINWLPDTINHVLTNLNASCCVVYSGCL